MRGRGKRHTGLGNAQANWDFPSLPPTAARATTGGGNEGNDRIDSAEPTLWAKRPPPQSTSPVSEPASKMIMPPPPGFAQTLPPMQPQPTYRAPEEHVPPVITSPSYHFTVPGVPQRNNHLHHGDQVPIGGDDLVSVSQRSVLSSLSDPSRFVGHDAASVAPSLTGTSVSSGSRMSNLTSTEPALPYNYLPKSELHSLYGQRGKLLSARYYHTWHDGGPAHALRWTSALVCPITSEIYLSAPYAGATDVKTDSHGNCYWFMKKSHAEHAAAAIAYDCWMLRNHVMYPTRLSLAQAYEQSSFRLPMSAPGAARLAIEELQREWQQQQANTSNMPTR